MAGKNTDSAPKKETAAPKKEAEYSVREFARAAESVFGAGTSPDIVQAALLKAGKNSFTVAEAKELVKAFAYKEVK